ncbi:hypothetical protein [Desulfosarcina cetonica]|nr:hypothetical protein [Desulfosarcina cetonica]
MVEWGDFHKIGSGSGDKMDLHEYLFVGLVGYIGLKNLSPTSLEA